MEEPAHFEPTRPAFVAHAAVERGANGVVCGHIHTAAIRTIGEVTYYNDGDWVESCTALVEHADGLMEILDWAEHKRSARRAATWIVNVSPNGNVTRRRRRCARERLTAPQVLVSDTKERRGDEVGTSG